jgi:hypothetical protein
LKAVFQSLVKPLTILFPKSLNFGVVPGDWKLANVSPINKGKGPKFKLFGNKIVSGLTNDWKTAFKNLGGRLSGPAGLEIFKI